MKQKVISITRFFLYPDDWASVTIFFFSRFFNIKIQSFYECNDSLWSKNIIFSMFFLYNDTSQLNIRTELFPLTEPLIRLNINWTKKWSPLITSPVLLLRLFYSALDNCCFLINTRYVSCKWFNLRICWINLFTVVSSRVEVFHRTRKRQWPRLKRGRKHNIIFGNTADILPCFCS